MGEAAALKPVHLLTAADELRFGTADARKEPLLSTPVPSGMRSSQVFRAANSTLLARTTKRRKPSIDGRPPSTVETGHRLVLLRKSGGRHWRSSSGSARLGA